MANHHSDTVQYRCTNRWGEPAQGIPKCEEYGSKNHPQNLVTLEVNKLPPRGIAPKCPSCGRDLVEVKGAVVIKPGSPKIKAWMAIPVIALVLVAAYLVAMSGHPKLQLNPDRVAINSVHPTQTFAIANRGRGTLHVTITPGRDAIVVKPSAVEVKAGTSADVEVSLNESAAKVSKVDTSLELTTNDPEARKVQVAIAWRNIGALLSEKFDQAHHELYR